MSDEAARKRAAGLRGQLAALRKGARPKPRRGDIREAVDQAAGRVRNEPPAAPRDEGGGEGEGENEGGERKNGS